MGPKTTTFVVILVAVVSVAGLVMQKMKTDKIVKLNNLKTK